jgi:NADPH:quinone reductase-like Zn-dependent oxidoreductase
MAIGYHRGLVTMKLKKNNPQLKGEMLAVGSSKDEVAPLIAQLSAKAVRIACFNSPTSLTISGDEPAIDELQKLMDAKQIFNRKLQVDVAYHSHHMKLVAEEYLESLNTVDSPKSTFVKFYSSLYGNIVGGSKLVPKYWVDNLTQSVRFSESLTAMCAPIEGHKTGVNMIIEIGPHSALAGPIKQILKACGPNAMKIHYASALVRKRDAVETALELASTLFVRGATLNLGAVNLPRSGSQLSLLVDMPRYPWNHKTKYWHESRIMQKHKGRATPRNDLLGTLAPYSNDLEPTWRNVLRIDDLPWLRHHKIQSLMLFPMAGFLVMALEAASQRAASRNLQYDSFELRDVCVCTPLMLTDEDTEMTLQFRPQQEATPTCSIIWDEFRIHSWTADKGWTEHCKGRVSTKVDAAGTRLGSADMLLQANMNDGSTSGTVAISKVQLYDSLSNLGVSYGPSFQGMEECQANNSCSAAKIVTVDTSHEMPQAHQSPMIIHPAFLEQLIEMYWPLLGAGRTTLKTIYLPSSIRRMTISRRVTDLSKAPGESLRAFCRGTLPQSHPRPIQLSMFATDGYNSQEALIKLEDLTVSPILERDTASGTEMHRELCYKLDWEPVMQHLDFSLPNSTSNGISSIGPNGLSKHVNGTANKNCTLNGGSKFGCGPVVIIHEESEAQDLLVSKLSYGLELLTGEKPDICDLMNVDSDGKTCLFVSELNKPLLSSLDSTHFLALQKVLISAQGILWVSSGAYVGSWNPSVNMITGLSRSIRSETLLKFATLDLDYRSEFNPDLSAKSILEVFDNTFGPKADASCELEFAERNGQFFTPRIVNDFEMNEYVHRQMRGSTLETTLYEQEDRPLQMAIAAQGDFETLHFVDQSTNCPLPDDEIEVAVKAIGMTFRDVDIAMGKVDSVDFGSECSGVVTKLGRTVSNLAVGDRVAAISISHGTYSTYTRTKAAYTLQLSDILSFEQAASIPVSYCTAHYGLIDLGRLVKDEPILIHGAASAVGQAALALARIIGADIFATVTSEENKQLLKELYDMPNDHIILRSNTCGYALQDNAQKTCFEVVLNCVPADSETLRDLWESLSSFGRFIDIGKQNASSRLGTSDSDNNKSFVSVDLMSLARDRPKVVTALVSNVSKLVQHGKIKPLLTTVFPMSDVEKAFRIFQNDNFEKLIVCPQKGDEVKVCLPSSWRNGQLIHIS